MNVIGALSAATIGYLLGAVSFARLVGKLVAPEKDVTRTHLAVLDSGKIVELRLASATSVSTGLGPKLGCLTSILDMLKVTIPTLGFRLACPGSPYFLIVAACGVIGHNWPVYYGFKGGRGLSPIYGGMLAIDWTGVIAVSFGGMVLGMAVLRDIVASYSSGVTLIIPWLWLRTHDWSYVAYAVVVNLAYLLASLSDIRLYLEIKREGPEAVARAASGSAMGRGLLRIAKLFGMFRGISY